MLVTAVAAARQISSCESLSTAGRKQARDRLAKNSNNICTYHVALRLKPGSSMMEESMPITASSP